MEPWVFFIFLISIWATVFLKWVAFGVIIPWTKFIQVIVTAWCVIRQTFLISFTPVVSFITALTWVSTLVILCRTMILILRTTFKDVSNTTFTSTPFIAWCTTMHILVWLTTISEVGDHVDQGKIVSKELLTILLWAAILLDSIVDEGGTWDTTSLESGEPFGVFFSTALIFIAASV